MEKVLRDQLLIRVIKHLNRTVVRVGQYQEPKRIEREERKLKATHALFMRLTK